MWTQHLATTDRHEPSDPLVAMHTSIVDTIDENVSNDDVSESKEPDVQTPPNSTDPDDEITAFKVELLFDVENEAIRDVNEDEYVTNDDYDEDEQYLIYEPDHDDDVAAAEPPASASTVAKDNEPIFGTCDSCGVQLLNRGDLIQHFRNVHGHQLDDAENDADGTDAAENRFACPHCPRRSYINQRHLNRHLELHHSADTDQPPDASARRCRYCRITIATNDDNDTGSDSQWRQKHYAVCPVLAERRQRPRPNDREPLRCLECLATYLRPQTLQRHYRSWHPNADWAAVERRMCVKCFRQFADERLAAEHVRDTHERWRCPLCQKLCSCAESLERHVRTHSGKQRPHRCGICGGTYVTTNQLKIHHRRKHTDERPFACEAPDCGKRYAERSELNVHRRAAHSAERLTCEWCETAFATAKYLGQHVAKEHTGEYRFFVCRICEGGERKFVNARLLNAHMAVHHPGAEVVDVEWGCADDEQMEC